MISVFAVTGNLYCQDIQTLQCMFMGFSWVANLWRKVGCSYSGPGVIHGYCRWRHLLSRNYGPIGHQLLINSPVSP